jgi:predicted transcriptional regulator
MEADMDARDIMTRNVFTTTPQTTIRDAARILAEQHISGLPVVDESGKIIGMVTEADIISKPGKIVADIMTKDVIAVKEDTPVEEIASLLSKRKIKRVPVVNEGRIVGIISRADIVHAVAEGNVIIRQW